MAESFDLTVDMGLSAINENRYQYSANCRVKQIERLRWKRRRSMPLRKCDKKPILCFAHVTNQMGRIDVDFEKGEADGTNDALDLVAIAASRLLSRLSP